MDSQEKTKKNNPNSEEGDTEKYYTNLCGWMEPKTCSSEPWVSPSFWVLVTQWHNWLVIKEKGSVSNWLLLGYLQVLLFILLGYWHHQFIQYLYWCIKSNPKRNNCTAYCLLSLLGFWNYQNIDFFNCKHTPDSDWVKQSETHNFYDRITKGKRIVPSIHKYRHHCWAHLWVYDYQAHSGSQTG